MHFCSCPFTNVALSAIRAVIIYIVVKTLRSGSSVSVVNGGNADRNDADGSRLYCLRALPSSKSVVQSVRETNYINRFCSIMVALHFAAMLQDSVRLNFVDASFGAENVTTLGA